MNILVVCDRPGGGNELSARLVELEHCVVEVDSVNRALQSLSNSRFDIVFADLCLPVEEELDFCRQVRDNAGGQYIYVILVAGRDDHEQHWLRLEAGADDHIANPCDQNELRARLTVAARILQMQTTLTDTMSILEAANRRFVELYLSLPIVCMTHDLHGGVHEYNRACERVFNPLEMMQLQRKGWHAVSVPNDVKKVDSALSRAFRGEQTENMEWAHPLSDGSFQYFLCSLLPLYSPDGDIVAAISAHVDITERKKLEGQIWEQLVETKWSKALLESQKERTELAYAELESANERLEALAFTDGLTGLMNHRAFQEQLRRECSTAARHGTPLSLLLLDIDNFKGYNDTFGHQSGDRVLKRVAAILSNSARGGDAVARYGGEEFVVILPNTDVEGSRVTAERFRTAIEAAAWNERPVTASVGAATLVGPATHPSILIGMADVGLYASKHAGRNRVSHAADLSQDETTLASTSEPLELRAA